MPHVTAKDGARIHYADTGEGAPIVFLHGWMMDHSFFRKQLDALSNERRCIALDHRGCGQSDTRPGTHNMDQFAADLDTLVQHLDLEQATLVGWSMGGGVTLRYLERHGADRARGVVLVDFPPQLREDPTVADKVCRKLEQDRDAYLNRFLRTMFLQEPDPQDVSWMMDATRLCRTETGCEMYRNLDPGGVQGTFDVPALLAFPKNGWFPGAVEDWKKVFARTVTPAFDASRHCPFLEEPERFNDALLDFTA